MPAAAPPNDEDHRLAVLRSQYILDTAPDPHFDGLVTLAADMFDVPIALVSLVDSDRQWFKAAHGLTARETDRASAFCAHAILRPAEILLVSDATLDLRFSDNPLVLGDPKIRFYAGVPVRADTGEALGTLCIIDRQPRELSVVLQQRLRSLADSVGAMIQLHRNSVELRRVATRDPLTGLANRAVFDQRLKTAVADAIAGKPCALLLVDLDRFKQINDTLGHLAGDGVLVEVARRLTSAVRGGDLVARLGGDEFAILTGPGDAHAANAIAARIVGLMSSQVDLPEQAIRLGLSIGIAHCPLDGLDPRSLTLAADQALYRAKAEGRGRIVVAGDGGTKSGALTISDGRAMEAALRDALEHGDLQLHWQPYFHAGSGAVRGYEALMRWHHPTLGQVSPGVFLPFAEATSLISLLDCWVLRTACLAACAWPDRFEIAVNVSAYWFSQGKIVDKVREALALSGLDPSRLEVELTERILVSNPEVARDQILALRDMGVHVALDDFGTGYSSLAYLRRFAFDKVKLDRAFIADLGADTKADAVARAIIQLGHALGMVVCGEGVETEAQLHVLRHEGCDLLQGFLLGRPAAEPFTGDARFSASGVAITGGMQLPAGPVISCYAACGPVCDQSQAGHCKADVDGPKSKAA